MSDMLRMHQQQAKAVALPANGFPSAPAKPAPVRLPTPGKKLLQDLANQQLVSILTAPLERAAARPAVTPVKQQLTSMPSYLKFKTNVHQQPCLRDDWLELTSRPWVAGSVDALLDNPHLTHLMAQQDDVAAEVAAIIKNIDSVLRRGDRIERLTQLVCFTSRHPAIYDVVEVAERSLTNDKIARLQDATDKVFATSTHHEALWLLKVVRMLSHPVPLEMLMNAAFALVTEERLNALLNYAETTIEATDALAASGRRLTAAQLN